MVIVVAAGVLALGTVYSSSLRLQTDILELLPQKLEAVSAFRDTARIFGALDLFPVVIDAPEGYEADDYEGFADTLAARLRKDPAIASVDSPLDLESPLIRYFQERLPLLVPPERLPELAERLSDEGIAESVKEDRRLLEYTPFPEVRELVVHDPLRLAPLLLDRFRSARGASRGQWTGGYVTSHDGKALLLIMRPAKPAQDTAASADLVRRVKEAIRLTHEESAKRDPELPQPRVVLGGRYATAVEDSALILKDLGTTISLSFLGVVLLYLFCYRRVGAIFYSVLPLILGQCLTFALARLVLGSLNSSTATSAALLMGLGTDFTIVMYARYVEERRAGQTLEHASRVMMGEAALGVYTGAITSAGTFGALMATSFVGLRQFGFMVASGILLCLVTILVLLPALVATFEGRRRKRPPVLYVHSFGIERLIPFSRRHPVAVALTCAVVTIALGVAASGLKLSTSITDLRSEKNAGVRAQEEIAERFGSNQNFAMVLTRGDHEAETLARARAVEHVLVGMETKGHVERVEGLSAIVPDPRAQAEVASRLVEGGATFDPDRVEATLRRELRAAGFKEEGFAEAIAVIRQSLRPEPITITGIAEAGGADLIGRFVKVGSNGVAAVSYVFGEMPLGTVDALRDADPTVAVTGVKILSRALKSVLRRDVLVCLGLGLVLVAVLLALDFRSWKVAMLPLMQLLAGLTWMVGAMRLFGIPLTMVNAFAAALLMGVGIDYGIHILHRLRGKDEGREEQVAETGKAVAMAAMTNVVGFGVLMFSNYPGLRGLGAAAVLGSIGCLLTALTLMPALEKLTRGKG